MKDERLIEMLAFKSVIELGGFTSASIHLGVSQPYISKLITNLEKKLGVTLIHRTTRKQKITEEGAYYLERVEDILFRLDELDSWAFDCKSQSTASGELRVTAPVAFGIDQISPLIPEFVDRNPSLKISLSFSDNCENLLNGSADVAIRMGRLDDSSLLCRRLCDLNRILVASKKYLQKSPELSEPEDLKQHNCLVWSGGREHLNKWPFNIGGETRYITAKGRVKCSNGLALMNMCYQGLGVMRMAEHVALPALASGKVDRVLSGYHITNDDGIYAVFLPEKKISPRIRVFVNYMTEKLESPPWTIQ